MSKVNLHVQTQVDTIDEALTWVVRQMDARGMEHPNVSIEPIFQYGPEESIPGAWVFGVSIGAEVADPLSPEEPNDD